MIKEVDGIVYETISHCGCFGCVAAPQYETSLCRKLSGVDENRDRAAVDCVLKQWRIKKEPEPIACGFGTDTKLIARVNALKEGKTLLMKHAGFCDYKFKMNDQRNVIGMSSTDGTVSIAMVGTASDHILWGYGDWYILDEIEEEVQEVITKKVTRQIERKI